MNLLTIAKTPLAQYIKKTRIKRQITQLDLAYRLNVTPQFLGVVERGTVACPLPILKELITELDLEKRKILRILLDATDAEIRRLFE